MPSPVKVLEQPIGLRSPATLAPAREPIAGPSATTDRYSRRVRFLKRMLPAIGLTLLLLVAVWPRLHPLLQQVRLGFNGIDMREARELRMVNPRYAGLDRYGRPYVVAAAVGRQAPDRNEVMALEQPKAVMTVHGGASVAVTAATGIYQSQAQLLDLFDDVNLIHENGTRFVTQRAHINLSDNTAEGHEPIEGHGPSGDIKGEGFQIVEKGDTIIVAGRSNLLLKGAKPSEASAGPPGLPGEVEESIAQTENAMPGTDTAEPTPTGGASDPEPVLGTPSAKPPTATKGNLTAGHAGKPPMKTKSRVSRVMQNGQ
jgi:lipopolysaccharide export system protein LptC